jgi:hypothetical protein
MYQVTTRGQNLKIFAEISRKRDSISYEVCANNGQQTTKKQTTKKQTTKKQTTEF